MGKKIKMKYSKAFSKRDARHYAIYSVLCKNKIALPYELADDILKELDRFPR